MVESKVVKQQELFDPEKIIETIPTVEPGKITTIFQGTSFWIDSDIYNSTGLKNILDAHEVPGTPYTPFIEDEASKIIEDHNGYFVKVSGDNIEGIFGTLEESIRCTDKITKWMDRDLTEYVIDYIAAYEILKSRDELTGDNDEDTQRTKDLISVIREIKDNDGAWYLLQEKMEKEIPQLISSEDEQGLEDCLEFMDFMGVDYDIKLDENNQRYYEREKRPSKSEIEEKRRFKEKYQEKSEELIELKDIYEHLYRTINDEIRTESGEKRGRLVAKSGISMGELLFKVEANVNGKVAKPEGGVHYVSSRMKEKTGPLKREEGKDVILVALRPENLKFFPVPDEDYAETLKEVLGYNNCAVGNDDARSDIINQYRDMLFNTIMDIHNTGEVKVDLPKINDLEILRNLPQLPSYFKFSDGSASIVEKDVIWTYKSLGIDIFDHPTFDERIPLNSPLVQKIKGYRPEILDEVQFLRTLERKFSDAGGGKLDITGDEETDRYKNARSLMIAALVRGTIDEIPKLYEKIKSDYETKNYDDPETEFYGDITKDGLLTKLRDTIDPKRMILTSLLWKMGGAKVRQWSSERGIPKYATRKLPPLVNQKRKYTEVGESYETISAHSKLKKLGVPELVESQRIPISDIYNGRTMLALENMMITLADRYIHHMSERSFKEGMTNPEDAIYAVRDEMLDILRTDGRGHTEKAYAFIETAFLRMLGLKKKNLPFDRYKRAAYITKLNST